MIDPTGGVASPVGNIALNLVAKNPGEVFASAARIARAQQGDPWRNYRLKTRDKTFVLSARMKSSNSEVDATYRFNKGGDLVAADGTVTGLATYQITENRDGTRMQYTINTISIASPLARVLQNDLQRG